MCWKQEWASAINNINWTIIHIERAQAKLRKRQIRNEATMGKLYAKGDKWSMKEFEKVGELVKKNAEGEKECKILVDVLRGHQKMLQIMIERYGITRAKESQRLKVLMTGNRKVTGKPWTDVRSSEDRSVDTPAI